MNLISNNYPSADEVAGWTLTLGGGVELPFADASLRILLIREHGTLATTPGWSAGDQVLVSIRNDEVQNRVGQTAGEEERAGEVKFKSRRSTSVSGGNIVYGKTHFSYDHEPDKFGPADGWELRRLNVTTDKTGDTDPVWITATFRTRRLRGRRPGLAGLLGRAVRRFPHAVPQVDLPRGRQRKGRSHLHAPAQSGQPHRALPIRPRRHLHMGAHVQGISTKTPGPGKPLRHERAHAGPATARHGETDRSG